MPELRLVIWDVDGTLVDSQGVIVSAMQAGFENGGLTAPDRAAVLGVVGLSLDLAVAQLAPYAPQDQRDIIVEGYKAAYFDTRERLGTEATSPFFAGMREVLDTLRTQDFTLMAVATGKSKRGLDKLVEGHGLDGYFVSRQVSDFHPSKPHPSMVQTILADTGVPQGRTVMIGDTRFDMQMGRAAGVRTLGVAWGYHALEQNDADMIVTQVPDLLPAIDGLIGE